MNLPLDRERNYFCTDENKDTSCTTFQ